MQGNIWARFGQAMGLLHLVSMAGAFVLPPFVGLGFERSGSYALPMGVMLGLLVTAFVCFALVDPRAARDSA